MFITGWYYDQKRSHSFIYSKDDPWGLVLCCSRLKTSTWAPASPIRVPGSNPDYTVLLIQLPAIASWRPR